MVGYVTSAIAKALRAWTPLTDIGIIPVFASGADAAVENVPIPAIAVHVSGEESHGNTYIGGGIRQYFELCLHVIIPVVNYTFSPDNNKQAGLLDISDEAIWCMEKSDVLDVVKREHDLNMQYSLTETYQTYATKGAQSVLADVHKIVYKCDVELDPRGHDYNEYVKLIKVIADNGINKIIIE